MGWGKKGKRFIFFDVCLVYFNENGGLVTFEVKMKLINSFHSFHSLVVIGLILLKRAKPLHYD
jgi:hypothetical protein